MKLSTAGRPHGSGRPKRQSLSTRFVWLASTNEVNAKFYKQICGEGVLDLYTAVREVHFDLSPFAQTTDTKSDVNAGLAGVWWVELSSKTARRGSHEWRWITALQFHGRHRRERSTTTLCLTEKTRVVLPCCGVPGGAHLHSSSLPYGRKTRRIAWAWRGVVHIVKRVLIVQRSSQTVY